MADASKLRTKRTRSGLGVPPGPDEVATSLNAPEIAPAVAATDVQRQQADSSPVHHEPVVTQTVTEVYTRRDGRSARKQTGRWHLQHVSHLLSTKRSGISQSVRG